MIDLTTGALLVAGCMLLAAVLLAAAVFVAGTRNGARYNSEDEQTREVATWFVEGNGEGE